MKHVDSEEQTETLRLKWTLAGEITLDASNKLVFPKVTSSPGLYKLCIAESGTVKRIYIGESDNLTRRFSHYRNPGPSQQTNIRINKLLIDHLRKGAKLTVLIVMHDCWVGAASDQRQMDLTAKLTRRMFEHFTAAMHSDDAVELLNL